MIGSVVDAMQSLTLQADTQKLVIAYPVDSAHLQTVDGIKGHSVCDLTLCLTTSVSFDFLKGCKELRELAIRVLRNEQRHVFCGFSVALPNLSRITLTNAILNKSFLVSLAQLPVVHVSLEGAEFVGESTVMPLMGHKTLTYLNVQGVSKWTHKLGRELFMLSRQVPKVEVLADNLIRDRSDYSQLLTKQPVGYGSYAFAALQGSRWQHPSSELAHLIQVKGRNEDSLWEKADGISLTHNVCELLMASPIKCPDNRMRIATQEPVEPEECYRFWQYVLEHDVSVIVMVKKHENVAYFSTELAKPQILRRAGYKEIAVTCTGKVYDLVNKRTTRIFTINDKVVAHLQMDWEDGFGVEVNRLLPLLSDVTAIEKQYSGKTIVHCWGGYGRTGTFFSCMILKQLMEQATNLSELYINLEELVRALRQQRHGMIAHPDQLETVLEFCKELLPKQQKVEK